MRGVLSAVVQLVIGLVAGYVMFFDLDAANLMSHAQRQVGRTAGRLLAHPSVSLFGAIDGQIRQPCSAGRRRVKGYPWVRESFRRNSA